MKDESRKAFRDILAREPFLSRFFAYNPSSADFSDDNNASFYNDFFCQIPSVNLLKDIYYSLCDSDYMCYCIRFPVERRESVISIDRYSRLITESISHYLCKRVDTSSETISLKNIIIEASGKIPIKIDYLQKVKKFIANNHSLLLNKEMEKAIPKALASLENYENLEDQKTKIIAGLISYLLSRKNAKLTYLLVYEWVDSYNMDMSVYLKIFEFVSLFLKSESFSTPKIRFFTYCQVAVAGYPEYEQSFYQNVYNKNLYENDSYYESELFQSIIENALSLVQEYCILTETEAGAEVERYNAEKLLYRIKLLKSICSKDGVYYGSMKGIRFRNIVEYIDTVRADKESTLIHISKKGKWVEELKHNLEYSHHIIGLLTFVNRHPGEF